MNSARCLGAGRSDTDGQLKSHICAVHGACCRACKLLCVPSLPDRGKVWTRPRQRVLHRSTIHANPAAAPQPSTSDARCCFCSEPRFSEPSELEPQDNSPKIQNLAQTSEPHSAADSLQSLHALLLPSSGFGVHIPRRSQHPSNRNPGWLGLSPYSQKIVMHLSALFATDSLAGSLINGELPTSTCQSNLYRPACEGS